MKVIAAIILVSIFSAVSVWWLAFPTSQLAATSTSDYILTWTEPTTQSTRLGEVQGLTDGKVNAFLGLPYAKPPIGKLRFRAPEAVEPWQETLAANAFPNVCMQTDSGFDVFDNSALSEDCLYINIFTPATSLSPETGENLLPVLFWIHGGSFTSGSANGYDGSVLAHQGGVIVVAINYRLGAFGFLDLSEYGEEFSGSASNGIRDQIQALKWVRDNIADYGGDASNVTIFGESAGGQSVLAILASPSADGLYHKAISHSGGLVNRPPEGRAPALAEHLSLQRNELMATLSSLTAQEVIDAQLGIESCCGGGNIDGTVVTRSSNAAILERGLNGVPLISGTNRDEGTLFTMLIPSLLYGTIIDAVAPVILPGVDGQQYLAEMQTAYPEDDSKKRLERVFGDLLTRGGVNSAVRVSAAGPGGWLYRFDLPVQTMPELGATHAAEIAFTFNAFANSAPDSAYWYDRRDPVVRELALNWSNTIIKFAKTGDPNGAGLPTWPRYTAETRKALILDATPRVDANLHAADLTRWGDDEQCAADL